VLLIFDPPYAVISNTKEKGGGNSPSFRILCVGTFIVLHYSKVSGIIQDFDKSSPELPFKVVSKNLNEVIGQSAGNSVVYALLSNTRSENPMEV
jgi:hypothetical protein